MMRLGIIGAGNFSVNHKIAIAKNEGCVLAAIADLVEEKAVSLAEGTDAAVYVDYKEMLAKENLDGVILNLPHFLHKEITISCLEQGVPVLVEKPMALSVAECDEMIEASKRTGVPFAVGHLANYNACSVELKKLTEEKALGELCAISETRTANYFQNRPEWFLDKKLSGGGIMMNLGAHYVDKVLHLTDAMPEEIVGFCSNKATDHTIEAMAQFLLKMPGDVSATGTFGGCQSSNQCDTYFYYTKGTACIRGGMELFVSKEGGEYEPVVAGDYMEIFYTTLSRQIEEFCKLIRGEENVATTPEHGRNVISVIEAVLK